jgi:rhodanese-related sulfurtransferase
MGPVVSMMASLQLLELINNIRTHFEGPSFLSTIDMNGGMSVRELSLTPNCSLCTDGKAHSAGLMEHASISSPRDLHISSTDFLELLKKKECTVIDVRERNHFDCSHLIESTNFPASAFLHSGLPLGSPGEFSELISKLDRTLVVVCRRGIDSLLFAQKVNDTWPHVKIVSLDGGLYGLNVRVI